MDYKVIVLAIDEAHVTQRLQKLLADENNQLKVDDAAKIVGCWKALSKQGASQDLSDDHNPMRRAVAFCQVIEPKNASRTHKVSSKNIASMFKLVVDAYQEQEANTAPEEDTALYLHCEAEHIDGSMNASEKDTKLSWLKADIPEDTCRILSNVRCLSEGVDVPALDAVLFLTPRNSQVDVVQSVGRVMRKAEGKTRGYIILPVVIPAGVEPHKALDDNKTYKVVWQVLQALRSHDDRFDAMINKLDLIGKDTSKMEVIAITDKIAKKTKTPKTTKPTGKRQFGIGEKPKAYTATNIDIFEVDDIQRAIYAKVVLKCGNRNHWEDWANDIAKIAHAHITRIQAILNTADNTVEIAAFNSFAKELRDDLNDAITDAEIIEMLAQHLITKPVFDALFQEYSFTQHNPMSIAMQTVLATLQEHHIDKEADTLARFYDSVKLRAEGIDSAAGKQKIVLELYDKFFRNAFPRMTERLGIVYTPVEVVDFIIHSVNDALQNEFGQTLGDKNVHIIDPFTGTGTFITRLLQSGLINKQQLSYKYQHEIHANEIVLLAYYIAAINIEAVYHDIVGGAYQPFAGICLTDTFQLHEKEDLVSHVLEDNNSRRKRQKALDIRVIIGNPPYSAGQNSANDNNANVAYPKLDESIRSSYAAHSTATNKNALYDSYIRAIRWASDRIGDSGIIGFVSNAGFIEANTADGLRKCLADEFSSIYVFHLRGNQRTSGELSRKEGCKIFGSGSRAPIAISILIKNPNATEYGKIYLHDIGDYLSQEAKLSKISEFKSINGITHSNGWQTITPDQHHDWLNQRDDSFTEFISLGDKKDKSSITVFENYSSGIKTNRDAWCYNYSKTKINNNLNITINFYNNEMNRYKAACDKLQKSQFPCITTFVANDTTMISWSGGVISNIGQFKKLEYSEKMLMFSLYRPFTKEWLYFDKDINERCYQMPRIFPDATSDNRVICFTGMGTPKAFSAVMTNVLPDIQLQANGQCFPLKLYEPTLNSEPANLEKPQADLFDAPETISLADQPKTEHPKQTDLPELPLESDSHPQKSATGQNSSYTVKDGISAAGLSHFQNAYPAETITKADVFYYIYGLLHSEDYKSRYADNLTKELPRIPCVKQASDFWAFSQAGRDSSCSMFFRYWRIFERARPVRTEFSQAGFGRALAEVTISTTSPLRNSVRRVTDSPLTLAATVRSPTSEWIA